MSVCVRMDVQARLSCIDSDGMENHVILEGKYGGSLCYLTALDYLRKQVGECVTGRVYFSMRR